MPNANVTTPDRLIGGTRTGQIRDRVANTVRAIERQAVEQHERCMIRFWSAATVRSPMTAARLAAAAAECTGLS